MLGASTGMGGRRGFTVLWTSSAASRLGASVLSVALPLVVLDLTRSPSQASFVAAMSVAGQLVPALWCGALADRYEPRTLMLIAELTRGLAMAVLVIVLGSPPVHTWQVALLVFVAQGFEALFASAEASAIRAIVADSDIARAISRNAARDFAADLIGAPLGGFLISFSALIPVGAVSVLLFLSAGVVARLRIVGRRYAPRNSSISKDAVSGLRYVLADGAMRPLIFAGSGLNLSFQMALMATVISLREAGASGAEIGLVYAALAVGGLIGALASEFIVSRMPARAVLLVGGSVLTLSMLGAACSLRVTVAAGMLGISCLTVGPMNVVVGTGRVLSAPISMQGRLRAATSLTTAGTKPLGVALGGVGVDQLGHGYVLVASGAFMLILAIYLSRVDLKELSVG